jgi:hypothetical protein
MDGIRLNAFTGAPTGPSALHAKVRKWIGAAISVPGQRLGGPGALVDARAWQDPDVGWGLVLRDDPLLPVAARATAADAPEPIQRLLQHRNGVVLRWSPDLPASKIRRCYADGTAQDPHLVQSERGTARGRIPRYLLLYGSPEILPWTLQYDLGAYAFTGRLDLDGAQLAHYVDAVLSGWDGAGANAQRAVTWAVDHGGDDITRLMRTVVAKKLHDQFAGDDAMDAQFIDGRSEPATAALLVAALESKQPGMIVTTSHGMTGPLDDVPAMRAAMGVPVDAMYQTLDVDALLANWSPDGALWYAHACCSAGSDAESGYAGLVDEHSQAGQILRGVAEAGALVAPLARRLLGAPRPLRAFLGHVEPTFDWTLKDRSTGQTLTGSLAEALYKRLYQPFPVGYAIEALHDKAPKLEIARQAALRAATQGGTPSEREEHEGEALTCRLVAQDLRSLVLLGDPAEAPFLG